MSHSEQFMTDVLEKVAAGLINQEEGRWDSLDMYRRQQIKQRFLPMVLATLDAAKEVRGETFVASSFPVQDDMVPTAFLTMSVSDDTRSGWTWVRLADGDLILGFFPCGGTYEALETVVNDDYQTALALDPGHPAGVSEHTQTVED